ncbi:MAG: hypothetical protein KBB95_06110, partial [Deltaproteobacteria bacterium]|nr:hypothetical protein [Deltaproteobacteria bacterium]
NVLLILALRRNLATEQFILLRADGLVRQVDTHYTHVAWDDVEQVAYDAERGAILLELRSGGQLALHDRYAGVTREALAKLMRDVHRKAIWGLLVL